jgi:hypothetical protein
MKLTKRFSFLSFLLASLMPASSAMAQMTNDRKTETEQEARSIDEISAARSQYTQTPDISPDANDNKTLAQLPRSRPGMAIPLHRGYPNGGYQTAWMDHGDARHAAIGAAIGFGLGALIGIKVNADQHQAATAGAVFIFGGVGAVFGGLIGGSHAGPFAFARRRRDYQPFAPEEDEESDRHSHSTVKESRLERSAAARIASPSSSRSRPDGPAPSGT